MRIFLFTIKFLLGISIFLLGLKLLGDSLSSILGFRLRTILTRFTVTKYSSTLTGFVATCLVQSSSVINSMMVVLVDSGVLSIHQALGVMLGANIGTTITAQIVVFPIEKIALPLVIAGLVLVYRIKRRVLGTAVLSLGAVFLGLSYTTTTLAPLLRLPLVHKVILELTGNPLYASLLGVILTAIVQSSSAVTGLVIGLAGQNLLPTTAAIAIALGSNIGTVVTTVLASLGRGRASRAAAYAELIFNLGGVLLVLPVFPTFVRLVQVFSVLPARQVAHAHTLFNVVTALAALPFLDYLARLAWLWAGIQLGNKNK